MWGVRPMSATTSKYLTPYYQTNPVAGEGRFEEAEAVLLPSRIGCDPAGRFRPPSAGDCGGAAVRDADEAEAVLRGTG
eukprot:gene22422-18900_t